MPRRPAPAAPLPAPAPTRTAARASALVSGALAAVLALAPTAFAAVARGQVPGAPEVPENKPQVLSGWTQPGAASQSAWTAARENRGEWEPYGFDWSTDYCTTSPDNPFGFPFRMACARHDFGYRNYRAAGEFRAAKPRLDDMFHSDLKRVCARYTGPRKASCEGTAWTYYRAVKAFK